MKAMLKNYWAILKDEDKEQLTMTNYELRITKRNIRPETLRVLIWLVFFVFCGSGIFAQVSATIDSTTIEIGDEIRYKMQVEADSTEIVVFPEGQTFTPLEVIQSQKIDTSRNGKRFSLVKEYALTQFDSGHYTIPRQKVMVGDKVFFTDSLKVEVHDVLVDTTKQKMYEIKPLVEVEAKFTSNWKKWLLWISIPLVLLALIAFFVFRKKKRAASKEDELPPYERAILALQKIDESHLLEQDSHKEYYSQLSDTARKYIDEEVYDHAMESTTDELITRLDEEIKTGNLNLDKATIEEFKKVLKTADMAKFAKSKPDIISAKSDRQVIEQVIHKTKNAIPEPTEEELLADEEYRKSVAEKKHRKRIIFGSLGGLVVIAITLMTFIFVKGYDVVKDTLIGHPTKELAEAEWISSAYGSPPVTIATPKVLIRNAYQMTDEQKQILKGNETFVYGSLVGNFYVVVTTIQYNKPTEVELDKVVEGVVGSFEKMGAKNISVKDEEYETLGGAKGVKVFGSLEVLNPVTKKQQKNDYLMLNFAENGGFQQVTLVYDIEDRYAKDIAQRIINSVELKNAK
ncbi:BatD family protein [Aquimarina sediminis]|uniref:BatD family protein n=1 Tax=Aquimarina sediminis TaxID=2070536 RepID=UPI000CA01651|nr:BatD family protein [Aquimarina sediminis]